MGVSKPTQLKLHKQIYAGYRKPWLTTCRLWIGESTQLKPQKGTVDIFTSIRKTPKPKNNRSRKKKKLAQRALFISARKIIGYYDIFVDIVQCISVPRLQHYPVNGCH